MASSFFLSWVSPLIEDKSDAIEASTRCISVERVVTSLEIASDNALSAASLFLVSAWIAPCNTVSAAS